MGEVKEPLISDDEGWEDLSRVHIPVEELSFDIEQVNNFCRTTDKFVLAAANPRPFERLQFLRGTENVFIDLILRPDGMMSFIKKMHEHNIKVLEKWCQSDVDGISFMDDWGTQNSMLINPDLWQEIFKPLYKDYIELAHSKNKKAFMHSDGNILALYPHFIEIGLDALNSQIFCIGIDKLKEFSGKITFWGEIDRQHLLPNGTLEEVEQAVKYIKEALWEDGGCIAQLEFGLGAKPENVYQAMKSWDK